MHPIFIQTPEEGTSSAEKVDTNEAGPSNPENEALFHHVLL